MPNAVVVGRAVPPVDVVYHFIPLPVAARFATVGLLLAQKVWGDEAVGAAGLLTETTTASREVDSQPLIV